MIRLLFIWRIYDLFRVYFLLILSLKLKRLSSGLPAAVHTAGAPGLRGQDPLLSLQLAPGVNQAAHHAEATRRRQLPSQKVLVIKDDI
jgi:hypothetical protein